MRAAFLVLAGLLATACSDTGVTTASVQGTWEAIAINEQPLPHYLGGTPAAPGGERWIDASTMTLQPDGAFTWSFRYRNVNPGGVNVWDEEWPGEHRYTIVRDALRLHLHGNDQLYIAPELSGRQLRFTLNDLRWTFQRR